MTSPATHDALALLLAAGEIVDVDGGRPIRLHRPDDLWIVEQGLLEVFAVDVTESSDVGPRSHILTIPEGECVLGMDIAEWRDQHMLIAVGRTGTRLRHFRVSELGALLSSDDTLATAAGALLERWVNELGERLVDDIEQPQEIDGTLEAGERVALDNLARVSSQRSVVWLEILGGNLLFVGMEALVFDSQQAPVEIPQHSTLLEFKELLRREGPEPRLFPLPRATWIEASNRPGVQTRIAVHSTTDVIGTSGFWEALSSFHRVLCQCEFINKRLERLDEHHRLQSKARFSAAAGEDAFRQLASVFEEQDDRQTAASTALASPLERAADLVGRAERIEIKRHPDDEADLPFPRRISLLARASRFRYRDVALRGRWWHKDHGPLLGTSLESGEPLALLPRSPRSYDVVTPETGARQRVGEAVADEISPEATSFYRSFPDGPLTGLGLLKFGLPGLRRDVVTLLLMGAFIGLMGTAGPVLTGTLFDSAIPQADRSLVVEIVVALLLVALVSAAFSVTRNIAALRIQGRMDYSIQAALWDRLLDLPLSFFRSYSAGDLEDRASGVNAIRQLVAGAGVDAMLGFASSLFFLGVMFYYSVPLAWTAVGLTMVFVGVTFVANLLQLNYQRRHLDQFGKLTGLVLQLILGVSKIRVAGAENHAFRMWSGNFSETKKLSYAAGRIQNRAQIFNSGFQVLSTMAIFAVLTATLMPTADLPGMGMSTGAFIAFNAAFGSFLAACLALSEASLSMLQAVPIYERLKPIVVTAPETDDLKAFPGRLKGQIEFSRLHFRYLEDGPWTIRDVNLEIQPGEFVALVGPSGSGKSTLLRLALGFETPEIGSVYYDGMELSTLDLRELRSQLGVVLQTGQLLPVDIYGNIVGGDRSLTLDDAWEAAELAGLAEDIKQMPMGMHTYVRDSGSLSGGQRQRLLIARAIVKRPRILLFDEATSALDNRTQAQISASLDRMRSTRIVVAHRLSTIRHADRICVVDGGEIVEQGNYEELTELGGLFAHLARRQQT